MHVPMLCDRGNWFGGVSVRLVLFVSLYDLVCAEFVCAEFARVCVCVLTPAQVDQILATTRGHAAHSPEPQAGWLCVSVCADVSGCL